MQRPAGSGATALLLALLVCGVPNAVLPCGHHVVQNDLRSLVTLHSAHQSAHPNTGAWGPASRFGGGQAGDGAHDSSADSLEVHGAHDHDGHEEGDAHGHSHGDDHAHCDQHGEAHTHAHEHGHSSGHEPGTASASSADSGAYGGEAKAGPQNVVAKAAARRSLTQTTPGPLRLSVTYQQLDALDASQQQMLTRVVESVRRILRKFILVRRPPSGGLLADPYCLRYTSRAGCLSYYPDFTSGSSAGAMCGLASLLPQHVVNPANCTTHATMAAVAALGSGTAGPASGAGGGASGYGTGCSSFAGTAGEATDMYLYITAVQNDDCAAGAAAWARPCLLDLGDNRPLIGAANVCPTGLRLLDEASLTAVVAHEMIHALGFTDAMYNLTRRSDGSPRPYEEVVSSAVVDGVPVMRLITPGVRDAARAHFGCDSLDGAQLEEDGSAGSAGSHWEYTHYQGEVMVASTIFAADGTPPALSNMTLSYLEDTGWYTANRSAAGLLAWGAGSGCVLPAAGCGAYMDAVPGQRLFCDPSAPGAMGSDASYGCSLDYKATGVCRSLNFTSGCGLLLSQNAEQTCLGPDAAYDMPDVFGWSTGNPTGRCFPIVYLFTAQVKNNRYTFPGNGHNGDLDAACFDTVCSADGSKVYVKLLGQQFECPAGAYLSLASLLPSRFSSGRIGPCPPASALCATQSCPAASCNPAGGDCLNGTCYCRLAFTGADCSYSLITGTALPNAAAANASAANSSSSAATPPSPPATVWTQVVQLSLSLLQPPAEVQARSGELAAALAGWADLDASAVRILLVSAANGSSEGASSTGDDGVGTLLSDTSLGSSGSTAGQVGQAYDATNSSVGSASRRRLRGHEPRITPHQRRAGLQASGGASSPLAAPSAPPPSPPAAASSVTAALTAGGSRATTILVSRLRDGTQVSLLLAALAAANFSAQAGSLSFQTVVSLVTAASQPPPAASATAGVSQAGEGASSSRMVIIVAIAAGGTALAGVVAALTVVAVIRARRASRANAAQQAKRAHAYRVSGGGAGGGGDGYPSRPAASSGGGFDAASAIRGSPAGHGLRPGGPPVSVQAYAVPDGAAWLSGNGAAAAGASPYAGGPNAQAPPYPGQPVPSPLYSGPAFNRW